MTEILQIFSGNPLSTFIGKKIEAATRPELESDDWALNLEICDLINENDDDAKDAVRAIKKRLQQVDQDPDFIITNRTLTVLETCIKNCSRRFHVLVMTKDFISDLVKLIGPKNNPPIELQERVLRFIEYWADAFSNQPDLAGVVTVYNELKAKGLTFPPRDPSLNVPIQTPHRSVSQLSQVVRPASSQSEQLSEPLGPIVLEGEGHSKISQDLGVVQSSIDMLNEIMRNLESNSDDPDWNLAADLSSTCRQMKERIMDLIERVANEDLTIELLRLNDDLNNAFIKYDRLVKNRSKSLPDQSSQRGHSSGTSGPGSTSQNPLKESSIPNFGELSLIDFNADDPSSESRPPKNQKSDLIVSTYTKSLPKLEEQTAIKTHQAIESMGRLNLTDSSNQNLIPEEISSVREQDFAEIENWLARDSGRDLAGISSDMPSIEPISITNSEFENFLANRALAGSAVSSSTPSSNLRQAKTDQQKPPL